MKVLVVGLGSMGKRRLSYLVSLQNTEIYCYDSKLNRLNEIKSKYNDVNILENIEELESKNIDCAFICTSPNTHADFILNLNKIGISTFSEINLTNSRYQEIIESSKRDNIVNFLSSTFLYRKEIDFLVTTLKDKTKGFYRHYVGQNLNQWHPWESIEDYFVSNVETNGIKEILAIELPWIVKCFGTVKNIHSNYSKQSSIEINYSDVLQLIVTHETGIVGNITIDLINSSPSRRFEFISEKENYSWNANNSIVERSESGIIEEVNFEKGTRLNNYSDMIVENPYISEINDFFDVVKGNSIPKTDYVFDNKIQELISLIESNMLKENV